MTTTINPFAGFGGQTEEIDTRTVGIPAAVIQAADNAVAHFAVRQNKKQLRTRFPGDPAAAEVLASQLSRYAAANGVTLTTLEVDGDVVTYRFAKTRVKDDGTRVDDPDAEDALDAEPADDLHLAAS